MPHHVPSRPIGCVLLLSILAFPGMTRAQCDVGARAGAVVVPGPPVPAVATNTSPFGAFQAVADFGALSASAAVDLPENSSDGGMNAIAEFDDQILITAPGVAQFTPGILMQPVGRNVFRLRAEGDHSMAWQYMDVVFESGDFKLRWFGR